MIESKSRDEKNNKENASSKPKRSDPFMMEDIDRKFDVLYERIHNMAIEQGSFNSMVKEAIENLSEPIQKQVDYLIKENEIIQNEL